MVADRHSHAVYHNKHWWSSLWTRINSEFKPSSAVNCVAPKRFKRWSFNSELPSDHRSNFDLDSTRGYACTLGNKYFPWYYCCKKLSDSNLILSKKTSLYQIKKLLMQLYWWSGYVKFLLYSFYVLFVLDKLKKKQMNKSHFSFQCLVATLIKWSNPNHSNKNSFVSILRRSRYVTLVLYLFPVVFFCWIN